MESFSKSDKIKFFSELSDEHFNMLYLYYKKQTKPPVIKKVIKKEPIIVNKNTEQYKVLLKFLNKILLSIDKPEITDLLEFKNIDRKLIISKKNIYDEMEEELYTHFDRKACNWYARTQVKHFILTFLRNTISIIGYEFTFIKKDVRDNIGNINYRKTHIFYSII